MVNGDYRRLAFNVSVQEIGSQAVTAKAQGPVRPLRCRAS